MNRVFRNKLYKLNNLVEVNHPATNHSSTTTRIDPTATARNPGIGKHPTGIDHSPTAINTHPTTTRIDPTVTTRKP